LETSKKKMRGGITRKEIARAGDKEMGRKIKIVG
jgi:hypothetical protein